MPKSLRRIVLFGFLSFIAYPLSYAPLDRVVYGDDSASAWFRPRRLPVFAPVLYLIDHTPIGSTLLWWSSVWGVESRHVCDRYFREDGYYGLGDDIGESSPEQRAQN
jgi:hypothetical protein